MKKVYTFFLVIPVLFLFQQNTFAQNAEGCDGVRYYYDVFNNITKTTLQYGSNMDAAGTTINLEMDIYEAVGDVQSKRPVMIWAHGGAFVAGERSEMDSLCRRFAKKGFVTATVSYRLFPVLQLGIPDSIEMLDAAMKAVGDYKSAIRYLRHDAATTNQFRIDTNFIFAGGVSAGAIIAVQTGYMDQTDDFPDYIMEIFDVNGGLQGSTGDSINQSYSSEVHAIFNLSGAIHLLDWMQADEPPIVSYHGTEDDVVPFYHGVTSIYGINFMSVNGSGSIHNRAEELGINNYLMAVPGADHLTAYNDPAFASYQAEFIIQGQLFSYDLLCQGIQLDAEDVFQTPVVKAYPNPSNGQIALDLHQLSGSYDVAVYDAVGKLILQESNQNDLEYRLRKSNVGDGVFFVQVRPEDVGFAPLLVKVVFE